MAVFELLSGGLAVAGWWGEIWWLFWIGGGLLAFDIVMSMASGAYSFPWVQVIAGVVAYIALGADDWASAIVGVGVLMVISGIIGLLQGR